MSAKTNNTYKTTFILDLRTSDDDAAKVKADLNELLGNLGASVGSSEDLGMRDFARAADRRYAQGHFLEVYFDALSTVPAELKEKLRLDKRVNRIFVETV